MDRAFEKGFLLIEDDYTIRIDWGRVEDDDALRSQLEPYDGRQIDVPKSDRPKILYLQRRRAIVISTE